MVARHATDQVARDLMQIAVQAESIPKRSVSAGSH
jgi:hypothetical protein